MKIIHLITGLSTGGAELSLVKLLSASDLDEFSIKVISLGEEGSVGKEIRDLGIPVINLGWKAGFPNPFQWLTLVKLLKFESPDILQTWMYHADLAGGICGKLAGVKHILWNIRNFNLDKKFIKPGTMWVVKACGLLSSWLPDTIIACSEQARLIHIQKGYAKGKFLIIPNGFDLRKFHPDMQARDSVRKELGLMPNTPLVGLVARYDPIKDHPNFIAAAGILHQQNPGIHFLLCGDGITDQNEELMNCVKMNGMGLTTHLLGLRKDIPRLTASLDVAVSSSAGEAFPNVIGEAMSCSVPCVVTDVGDSAFLVGETGKIVPPHNHQALAEASLALLEMSEGDRRRLGLSARQRIVDNFELSSVVQRYETLYRGFLAVQ